MTRNVFRLLGLVAVLTSTVPLACATSRAPNPQRMGSSSKISDDSGNTATCEVTATFEQEEHDNAITKPRVFWKFNILNAKSISGGMCPTGSTFKLLVWGGRFAKLADGTESFVYLHFIRVPQPKARVVIRTRKETINDGENKKVYNEWTPINWEDGIEFE